MFVKFLSIGVVVAGLTSATTPHTPADDFGFLRYLDADLTLNDPSSPPTTL
jgi:hypothetical protein